MDTIVSRALAAGLLLLGLPAAAQQPVTTYTYDPHGNLTAIAAPLGRTTANAYDALNRLTQTTDPAGGEVRYGYDALDRLTRVTDPRGLVTQYQYNALGDLKQQVSPDTGTTTQTYDTAGNVLTRINANGTTATYTYDATNRVTGVTYSDGQTETYTYDEGPGHKGRLTTITFPQGSTQYSYDLQGRVTQKRDIYASGPTLTVQYGWQPTTGRLTSITYPSGKALTIGHDATGRVTSLAVDVVILSNVTYFPFGPASSWLWGNGQMARRSFDLDGRLTSFPLAPGDSRSIVYDPASRITALNHPTNGALNQTFGYDVLDRLTSWTSAYSSRGYGYDANGNRAALTIGANHYSYATPATSNRLASTSGPSPARSFLYDAAGNTTADGEFTLNYNDRGRLVQAVKGSTTTGYMHDGLGQRVRKTGPTSIVPTGTNYFVYDEAGKLLGEYDNSGAVIREYVYLGDIPVAVLK